jgi:hypothetical protein
MILRSDKIVQAETIMSWCFHTERWSDFRERGGRAVKAFFNCFFLIRIQIEVRTLKFAVFSGEYATQVSDHGIFTGHQRVSLLRSHQPRQGNSSSGAPMGIVDRKEKCHCVRHRFAYSELPDSCGMCCPEGRLLHFHLLLDFSHEATVFQSKSLLARMGYHSLPELVLLGC